MGMPRIKLHPIAAQGLYLSLRDIALRIVIEQWAKAARILGEPADLLEQYQESSLAQQSKVIYPPMAWPNDLETRRSLAC